MDLLIEILSCKEKEELLDLYILLYKIETELTRRITLDVINPLGRLKNEVLVCNLKRYTENNLLKVYKADGFYVYLILRKLQLNDIENLVYTLNLTMKVLFFYFIEFLYSYLEYKPIFVKFSCFTVLLQFKREKIQKNTQNDSGITTNYKWVWCLEIFISQDNLILNNEKQKIHPVIDLITDVYLRFFKSVNSIIIFFPENLPSKLLKIFLENFVASKNVKKTYLYKDYSPDFTKKCIENNFARKILMVLCSDSGKEKLYSMQIRFTLAYDN